MSKEIAELLSALLAALINQRYPGEIFTGVWVQHDQTHYKVIIRDVKGETEILNAQGAARFIVEWEL